MPFAYATSSPKKRLQEGGNALLQFVLEADLPGIDDAATSEPGTAAPVGGAAGSSSKQLCDSDGTANARAGDRRGGPAVRYNTFGGHIDLLRELASGSGQESASWCIATEAIESSANAGSRRRTSWPPSRATQLAVLSAPATVYPSPRGKETVCAAPAAQNSGDDHYRRQGQ